MFIHVDFPSHAVLSARTEGSGPAWNHVTRNKGPHVFGAFRRARSWKAEIRRKRQKVEPWKRLSSARQLICSPPPHLWFHITFLLCFEHGENIIQIILLGEKKSNHYSLKWKNGYQWKMWGNCYFSHFNSHHRETEKKHGLYIRLVWCLLPWATRRTLILVLNTDCWQ